MAKYGEEGRFFDLSVSVWSCWNNIIGYLRVIFVSYRNTLRQTSQLVLVTVAGFGKHHRQLGHVWPGGPKALQWTSVGVF